MVVVAAAAKNSDDVEQNNKMFRLDFSPFATFDLPRRLIHSQNREAMGDAKTRRSSASGEEEKRDPCYSVIVKLGKKNEYFDCFF